MIDSPGKIDGKKKGSFSLERGDGESGGRWNGGGEPPAAKNKKQKSVFEREWRGRPSGAKENHSSKKPLHREVIEL